MQKLMTKEDVQGIIDEMAAAGTSRNARIAMAKAALSHARLTASARKRWDDYIVEQRQA